MVMETTTVQDSCGGDPDCDDGDAEGDNNPLVPRK